MRNFTWKLREIANFMGKMGNNPGGIQTVSRRLKEEAEENKVAEQALKSKELIANQQSRMVLVLKKK